MCGQEGEVGIYYQCFLSALPAGRRAQKTQRDRV